MAVQTVEDLITQLLSSVLGGGALGQLGVGFLQKPLLGALGLQSANQRDALLDFVVSTDMTPFGTALDLRNRQFTRLASANVTRLQNASLKNWLTEFGRATMSRSSFSAMHPEYKTAEDIDKAYNAHIEQQAAGWASNPLWGMVYRGIDPDGVYAASSYLQQAGANVIRRASLTGRRDALLQARAIGNLFTGAYNAADYGYMNIGESAAVAAALTKDLDFIGTGANTKERLDSVTKKLQKAVQDYTKALGPLKDVFGKDVPAMIKAVEELSGRRFTNTDAAAVSRTVRQVLDGATAGNYTLQQVVGAGEAWRGALLQMNVPFLNDLSSVSVATTLLNATAPAGAAPRYMSQERWEKQATDRVTRASVSNGGAAFAQAYAIMLQKNKNMTVEQFMDLYDKSFNGSIDQTLYAMTGTRNAAEMQRRAGESGMLAIAYESNMNTIAALEMGARQSRVSLSDKLRMQGYSAAAIDEMFQFFDRSSHMDFGAIAQSKMSAAGKAVANTVLSLDEYQNEVTGLRTFYNTKEAAARTALVAQNRQLSENIQGIIGENWLDAANNFVKGRLTWDSWKKENAQLQALKDPNAVKTIEDAYKAASLISGIVGAGKNNEQVVADIAKYQLTNGLTDDRYLDKLEILNDKTKSDEARRNAARNIYLYSQLGSDAVEAYVDVGSTKKEKQKRRRALLKRAQELEKDGKGANVKVELQDMVQGDALIRAINERDDIQDKEKLIQSVTDAYRADGRMTRQDWENALKGNGVSASTARELMTASGTAQGGLEALLTDKFDVLDGLAEALRSLSTNLEKIVTKDATADEERRVNAALDGFFLEINE